MVFRYFSPYCAKEIVASEPPAPNIDNFLYWKYTEDGAYSSRSGYFFLWSQSSAARCIRPFVHKFPWKHVWRKGVSPKFSIMLWRIAHNIMPTSDNLISKNVQVDPDCQLYWTSPESADHLFRSCSITQHVWKSSALGVNALANPSISFTAWIADFISYLHHQSMANHYFKKMRSQSLSQYAESQQRLVSPAVTCCKLSSVLARSLPVPISVRNSFREIRALFVLYLHWSVSLATG
ncbi:uncharacterized protein LOC141651918 [Silene latifolia]|uniref:uncharacterized protein LOC141651918 n=1 Tax=Silene latifolia TaxID=37657 RepID=UPI003D77FE15